MKTTAQKWENRLEDLLKRITSSNVHHEIDFGGPAGREVL
jgi:antitoxin component of MazEF toxin-antitoxin module